MATMDLLSSEWTARDLRPVARWVPETDADGRDRLVMVWSVPDVAAHDVMPAAVAGRAT